MNVLHSVDFDVRQCIDGALLLLAHRIKHSRVRVEIEVPRPVLAHGDPSKFDQIVTNLVQNALSACDESGRGTRVVIRASGTGGDVDLEVEDDGPGVPEALRKRIFEPLFTTRAAGTGLGLAIAKDLAEGAFSGQLSLVPTTVGARFVVRCGPGVTAARPAWAPAGAPSR